MKQLIILLFAVALIAQSHGWQSNERSDNSDQSSREEQQQQHQQQQQHHNHNHNQNNQQSRQNQHNNNQNSGWDSTIADLPDARPFVEKIDNRLDKIPDIEDNQELKRRVINFANEGMHLCKSHSDSSRLHHHCVGRLIGSTMSMINNQQWHQDSAHVN